MEEDLHALIPNSNEAKLQEMPFVSSASCQELTAWT